VLLNSAGSRCTTTFLQRLVEHLEVDLPRERGGAVEHLGIVADVQSAHLQPALGVASDHRVDIDDGQVLREMLAGVIQDAADRRVGPPHHAFHAIGGADKMAAVDAVRSPRANEEVFVVVRHADDLVRHDLADGQDEVVAASRNQVGELNRPREIHRSFRNLADKRRGHLAQRRNTGAPVVDAEQPRGTPANIPAICSGVIGVWVPSAGSTSVNCGPK